MTDLNQRKQDLQARARLLTDRMGGIAAELISHQARDWEDLAVEREGEEVLESLGQEAQVELRAIAAALARIEGGRYGTCQTCGAKIAPARLDLLPFTPFCTACAR